MGRLNKNSVCEHACYVLSAVTAFNG